MDAKRAASEFGRLYADVYRHLHRRRDPRAHRPSGETLALLQHLRDTGPLTVTEAARHFDRSQSAMSERMERMLERGLLARLRDERDRRRHLLWLTPDAERLLREETEVLSSELLGRAAQRMNKADRQALVRGMRGLLDAAKREARAASVRRGDRR